MIGFEAFLLLNHNNTDDTQCILDAYADEGVVIQMPQDMDNDTFNLSGNVDNVVDACTRYLKNHPDRFDPSHTWMMTHDTDEFVWFDRKPESATLCAAIDKLIEKYGTTVQSLNVPRLLMGASGQDHYDPGLVMDRFTHRFNLGSCRYRKQQPRFQRLSTRTRVMRLLDNASRGNSIARWKELEGRQRRRLFNKDNPTSYCDDR